MSPSAPGMAFSPRSPGSLGEWSLEATVWVCLLNQLSGSRARSASSRASDLLLATFLGVTVVIEHMSLAGDLWEIPG